MKAIFTEWTTNLRPRFRDKTLSEIQKEVEQRTMPVAVLISNLQQDFNIGTIMRSANALGVEQVFYFGKRAWDRRGCVGSHNYLKWTFLPEWSNILELKARYQLVALENNRPKLQSLYRFRWDRKPLCLMIGEEGPGLTPELIDLADHLLEIPQIGTVPSLNAATAATVALSYLRNEWDE